MHSEGGPPRSLIIAAVVVAVGAIAAVFVLAASRQAPSGPVVIATVPAPAAQSNECQALLAAVPDDMGDDYRRAATAQPTPPGAAAWRAKARTGTEPVVMRCGLDRPAEFVVGSPIQMVDDVQWFRLQDRESQRSTWLCVDRPVYVALTLPAGSGPTPIQRLSGAISRTMPAVPIRPGAAR